MNFTKILDERLEKSVGDLPVLPQMAAQALALAKTPNLHPLLVLPLVEDDPVLASRIMAHANSAMYYRGITVRALPQALIRLGTETIKDLLYAMAYSAIMGPAHRFHGEVKQAFRHSVLTARACRRIGSTLNMDPELCFLAGLLHDIGRPRCLKLLEPYIRNIAHLSEALSAIEELHPKAGAMLANAWGFPDVVVEACAFHHQPNGHPLAQIVAAGDAIARRLDVEVIQEALMACGVPAPLQLNMISMSDDDFIEKVMMDSGRRRVPMPQML
jgi:putative nucleotidyltransferase with HDIG domain